LTVTKTSFQTALFLFLFGFVLNAQRAEAQALPVVSPNPSSVSFLYQIGGATPPVQNVVVSSTGAPVTVNVINLSFQPVGSGNWLTVIPAPGTSAGPTPASLTFICAPSALPAGIYAAQVLLSYSGSFDPNNSTSAIYVYLAVTASGGGGVNPGETVTASPTSLAFAYTSGGSVPAAQALSVSTSDAANFTATAVTNDGNQWLQISPSAGTSPGTINVSVNPTGLAAGTYNANITVAGPSASIQVPVTLVVGGLSIIANPSTLTFNLPQNYGYGAPQYIQVTSASPATFQSYGASDSNWLVVDTVSGTTPATVTVRANSSNLAQGSYVGTVTIQTSPSNYIQVPVTMVVGAPATLSLSPASLNFSYTVGGATPPNSQVNVKSLTGAALTFAAVTSTSDGAAWLQASATSPTPGTVSVGVSPTSLIPGTYNGVVNITSSATGSSPEPVVVTLTVNPAPTPTVTSIVSAASYAGGSVAPGEFVVLFGSALGPAALTTPTPGTAPGTLGGTAVTFDGITAPILYSSATQTSVQVPYGINSPQTVVKVTRTGVTSAGTTLNSLPTFPGLFTADSSGKGQAAALNGDYSLNSPSNPAKRGSIIILYGTGEGKTNPVSVEGTITPSIQPLPQPLYPVTVTFGGVPGVVAYAGETPTALAGLMQINVTIPANAPVGAVPVLVTINGQTSPGNVTVSVQ
jgi:uncharacterized protein (TIGR03437 family)